MSSRLTFRSLLELQLWCMSSTTTIFARSAQPLSIMPKKVGRRISPRDRADEDEVMRRVAGSRVSSVYRSRCLDLLLAKLLARNSVPSKVDQSIVR